MSPLSRSLSLALLLLAVFLSTVLTMQWWLQRESARLLQDTRTIRQEQLAAALQWQPRPQEKWDADYQRALGRLLDGKITLLTPAAARAEPAASSPNLVVEQALNPPGNRVVRLTFLPPSVHRLAVLQRRVLVATIVVSLLLLLLPLLFTLLRRNAVHENTTAPFARSRASAEMSGLEHIAKLTVERGQKLAEESDARLRAEENLQVSRSLLTQSQDERARLGRELHDNICQTLYAVSLTLESVRRKISATPEVWQRLEQSIGELRRLNQEVRAYLGELEPEQIRMRSFADALNQMLDILPENGGLKVSRLFDDEVVSLINAHQTPEVVNILREAISNAARHGHARHITLRAEQDDNTIALAVQDDGTGFPDGIPANPPGHGLGNMEARAKALGGTLRVESSVGKGTRVVLLLPVVSATA